MDGFPVLSITVKGKCLISDCTSASENLRPMRRLASKTLKRKVGVLIDQYDERDNSRVVWVHRDLVLCSVANETFGVRERNIRWGCPVTLVVGDDLNAIILPDTDATVG